MAVMVTLPILVWLCFWRITVGAVRDSLKPGDVLNHSSVLLSANHKFSLKFDTVGSDFTHTYLVIAHTGTSIAYKDWIANRNNPITNNSGTLTLGYSGDLTITRQNGKPITLYSPVQPTNNTIVTLIDSGNLVLQELHRNGSTKRVLWQSFDHPSDILLPYMKLGVNHKTGQFWSLRASVSDADPASGSFTLEWEPRRSQLIIKRRGQIYWTSGLLRNEIFEHIPKEVQRLYEYKIVSDEDEETISYTNQHDESQWVLFPNGQLMDTRGNDFDIARADTCYGYNTEGGCQRWEQPKCRQPGKIFTIRSGYFDHPLVGGDSVPDSNISLDESDCKATCWTNCTCIGFTTYFPNGTGCHYYHGPWKISNLISRDASINILDRIHSDHKDLKKWIITGSAMAAALIILCLGIFCLILRRKKSAVQEDKRSREENELLNFESLDRYTTVNELQNEVKKGNDLRVFSYASIMAATNGFSPENMLAEGGFGPVYKGLLPMGQEIAIKRLSRGSAQGVIEFKNELTLISELQHMNLVQLLGCCIHGEERILIYEFMPNKSLDFFLFDSTQSKLLDWRRRFNIIEGIAQGLLYLHRYSRLRIVHRDLKASNILLDDNMNPKISDFGMARIFTQESEVNTNRIVGTYGYMAPEYAMEGIFSIKSDVYSFGVLLLEIVGGRRNNSFYNAQGPLNLIGQAWELWNEGLGLELVDPTLRDSCIEDQVLRCIHVGLLCVEESAVHRPTMSDIITMLTSENGSLPLPRRPAFYSGRKPNEEYKYPFDSEYCSVNLSISNTSAR